MKHKGQSFATFHCGKCNAERVHTSESLPSPAYWTCNVCKSHNLPPCNCPECKARVSK